MISLTGFDAWAMILEFTFIGFLMGFVWCWFRYVVRKPDGERKE